MHYNDQGILFSLLSVKGAFYEKQTPNSGSCYDSVLYF